MSICAVGLLTRGFIITGQEEVIYVDRLTSGKSPKQTAVVEVRPSIRPLFQPSVESSVTVISAGVVIPKSNVSIPPATAPSAAPKLVSSVVSAPKMVKAEEE